MNDVFENCVILGVTPDSTLIEVKRAYRNLALEWHPDRVQADERKRRVAEQKLKAINRAYRALMREKRNPESPPSARRPAEPGYDPISWRQSAAESCASEARTQDDRAFYKRALDLHYNGIEHFNAARYREAVSVLTQSVCLVPNNIEAYHILARAHRRLNQPAKSASAYQRALLIDPESIDCRIELGELLLQLGDSVGAANQAASLRTLDPELADALTEYIRSHMQTARNTCDS